MKFAHVLIILAALPLAACASNKKEAEAPPPAPGQAAAAAPRGGNNPLERLFGANAEPNAGPCPLLGVLYDSSRLVEFTSPEERFANVAYTAEMRGVRGLCRYTGTNPIEMNLQIDMAFGKGPAARGDSRTYRYWVAVTRSNLAPVEKQYFDVKVDFPGNADRMAGSEVIQKIVIPRANDTISGANFEILVGFELTPEQLAFNRSGKRFRVDVGRENPNTPQN
jgi:hypothetical protein